MRFSRVRAVFWVAVATAPLAAVAQPVLSPKPITFEVDAIGAAPTGFEFARTGGGPEGKWVIQADKDNAGHHVLAQTSPDPTDFRFPLAIVKDGIWKDVTLTVRARAISGKVDQGFGLVWRYRDSGNYYVARCNADEDSCTIYHVVKGSRRSFQNKAVRVATNSWHTLKVEATGEHFVVLLDGQTVLDAKDEMFKEAGKVGLWTKADSVIQFDDLVIEGR